jgi:hypothetical protein
MLKALERELSPLKKTVLHPWSSLNRSKVGVKSLEVTIAREEHNRALVLYDLTFAVLGKKSGCISVRQEEARTLFTHGSGFKGPL